MLMAGDALADKEFGSITGPAGEGMLFTFGARSAQEADRRRDREEVQGQEHRSGRLHALHLCRVADRGRRPRPRPAPPTPRRSPRHIKAGNWDTVLGKITYDKKGDITVVDYVVYKWDKD